MCEILRAGMRNRTGVRGGEDEDDDDDDDDDDDEEEVGLVARSF